MCSEKTNSKFFLNKKETLVSTLLFCVSLIICAFAQPHYSALLCMVASFVSFGLFFYSLKKVKSKRLRFALGLVWFFCVQASLLLWLATPDYQGVYVYFLLTLLCLLLGVQFGFLTALVGAKQEMKWPKILFLSALWTLFEWSRHFFLCGFIWNPVGLTLTALTHSAQLASLAGVYGLSFLVMLCNMAFYRGLVQKRIAAFRPWALLTALPFVFSFCYITYQSSRLEVQGGETLKIALVQTSIYPREKNFFPGYLSEYVNPYLQWERIMDILKSKGESTFDLIVLPEAAVGFDAKTFVYTYGLNAMESSGIDKACLAPSYAQKEEEKEGEVWRVNNLFFAKMIAHFFKSEVIIGLEEFDENTQESFVSAFFIQEGDKLPDRYDKRILLPVAEYLPGALFRKLALRYGMSQFFTHGIKAGVFDGRSQYYPTICYEECFGHQVRKGRLGGGKVLVNLSNDAWYPHSKLNYCHFDHGRLRAIENGVYQIRACNTGLTAAIDPFGRVIGSLESEYGCENIRDALVVHLPRGEIGTLYAKFGDITIITLCLAFIAFFGLYDRYKRKKT